MTVPSDTPPSDTAAAIAAYGEAVYCYVDRDGVIVKTNSRFDGMQPADFIGLRLADFMAEPSRSEYLSLLERTLKHGEVGSYTNVITSSSGESRWFNRVSPWRQDGNIIGAVMVGNRLE